MATPTEAAARATVPFNTSRRLNGVDVMACSSLFGLLVLTPTGGRQLPPTLVTSSYVQQRLWFFRVNDREPFLLGSLAQSGIRTEEIVKLLLAFEPESGRKLQGIERPQRKDRALADQKTNGLPLMHRDRSDESELAPAQVGIEAPESLLKSRNLQLSCADLASQR